MQQSPQAHDRHHDAANIGQSEQARRHKWHMRQNWRPNDFRNNVKTQTEGLPRKLEYQEIFEYLISIWRDRRSSVCRKLGRLPGLFPSASHRGSEWFRPGRQSPR
jgi:hypothetical protein